MLHLKITKIIKHIDKIGEKNYYICVLKNGKRR